MAAQQNGNAFQAKGSNSMRSAGPKEVGTSDNQAHERLMYLFGAAVVWFILALQLRTP